jgi:hypothetical protein
MKRTQPIMLAVTRPQISVCELIKERAKQLSSRAHMPLDPSQLPDATWQRSPLLQALILFRQLPEGFSSADLRRQLAALSACPPQAITQGAATYQLRRLRLRGLIERVPRSFRYRGTQFGGRVALCSIRAPTTASLRPALAAALPDPPRGQNALGARLLIDAHLAAALDKARLAA